MPVDTVHPEYKFNAPLWEKCRDASAGEDTVKARAEQYLPKLSAMEQGDYAAYLMRAMFFSATGRTIEGLSGAILRKSPTVEWPEARMGELDDLGHGMESLDELSKTVVTELLEAGRVGLLVDAEADGLDPYVSVYFAENIVNWKDEVVGGRKRTTMVVLRECRELVDPKDPFIREEKTVYRVLLLGTQPAMAVVRNDRGEVTSTNLAPGFTNKDLEEPFYFQEVWVETEREGESKKTFVLEATIVPRRKAGRLWNEIPFVFSNANGCGSSAQKPPLLDLVNVNLSHYRNSADLEHGLHFTALPTPWAAGMEAKTVLRIGSGTAWIAKDPEASFGMLEFTGNGLAAIEARMASKESRMAILGARLLEGQKPAQEAAAAIRLRSAGEQSALANISISASDALSRVMRWVFLWTQPTKDEAKDIYIQLNKDFNLLGLDPQMLAQLVAALQSGAISFETFVFNLSRGELLPDGTTAEDEVEAIRKGLPAGMGMVFQEPPEKEEPENPDDDNPEDEQ